MICDRYALRSLLGEGGMGRVYEAFDRVDEKAVAAKTIRLGDGVDWKTYELFERSCKTLQYLDEHPALPRIYDFERRDSGQLFLVRQIFEGGTLESRIRDEARHVKRETMRAVLSDLLDLMRFLHQQTPPILHRDIKPANIMFRDSSDWKPVLVDFDTLSAPEGQRSGLTVVGTPGYTAPEQLIGAPVPASDLYSLGATMLFMATHTEPDDLPRKAGRIDLGDRLDTLGANLKAVIARLVEPDLTQRFASAQEALDALDRPKAPTRTTPTHELTLAGQRSSQGTSPNEAAPPTKPWFRRSIRTPLALVFAPLVLYVVYQSGLFEDTHQAPVNTSSQTTKPAQPANALEEAEQLLATNAVGSSGYSRHELVAALAAVAVAAGETGDRRKADAMLARAIATIDKLEQGFPKALAMGPLGCAYTQLGDPDKGDALVQQAEHQLSANVVPYTSMLATFVRDAQRCLELGDTRHTKQLVDWAVQSLVKLDTLSWYDQTLPHSIDVLEILVALGDAAAVESLSETFRDLLGSKMILGHALVAEAYWRLGDTERALALVSGLEPSAHDLEGLAFVGHANAVVGRTAEAKALLDQALELMRREGEVLYYYRETIAAGFVRLGDLERARGALSNPGRWGNILVREQRYDEAIACDCPTFPGSFDLALALSRLGRHDDAWTWARKVDGFNAFKVIALATVYRHSAAE